MWVVLSLTIVEIDCMFPFQDQGDFASIGRFLVHGIGSIAFISRALAGGLVFSLRERRLQPTSRCRALLMASLLSPALVWTMQSIAHPPMANARTVEAYSAGPELVVALFRGLRS